MFGFRSFILSILTCIFLSTFQSDALAKKVRIELIPIEQKVQIRTGKETFEFDVLIQNQEESALEIDVWMTVEKQREILWPVSGPISITLEKWYSIRRHRVQEVCGRLKKGRYRFVCSVGQYPDKIFGKDSFPFRVLEEKNGLERKGWWFSYGQNFADNAIFSTPADFGFGHPRNPFCPPTNVGITLPRSCHIRIDVFNSKGSFASDLFEGDLSAGYHQIRPDVPINELKKGVYFLRYQADSFTAWVKMILIK